MASLEDVFHACQLALHVPDATISLPNAVELDGVSLLDQIQRNGQREQAFFDERLYSYLSVSFPNLDAAADGNSPSQVLLQFLSHLSVTLDASYVGRAAVAPLEPKEVASARLTLPPHVTGAARPKLPRSAGSHPSIFPPTTPNPIPQSDDNDSGYIQADAGVPLYSYSWGEGPGDDLAVFALLRSNKTWVAVYRLDVTVAFVRNIMRDPMLCLTVSATMRDRPVAYVPQRQTLFDLISSIETKPGHNRKNSSVTTMKAFQMVDTNADEFEEVNLLEGLSAINLDLPSTRIGPSIRKESYALPSRPSSPPVAVGPVTRPLPTLRKSYRKTLVAVSGFSVKMRSVLSPAVVIPGDMEDEQEATETGSEERSIVLCVELENTGESKLGFQVDDVHVTVSGEGARAKLISWGEYAFEKPNSVFPLHIGAREQFNLLYAVSFLRPSEEPDASTITASRPPNDRMLRSVSIAIRGRPFETRVESSDFIYPSLPFVTRWSCTLNLQPPPPPPPGRSSPTARDALPAPPSPFPSASPGVHRNDEPQSGGARVKSPGLSFNGRRNTVAGGFSPGFAGGTKGQPTARPLSMPIAQPLHLTSPGTARPATPPVNKFLPPPPSIAMQPSSVPGSPLHSPVHSPRPDAFPPGNPHSTPGPPPQTPAYPAYTDSLPGTPRAFSPMAFAGAGQVGPSVEARRERVPANAGLGLPMSPLPLSPGLQQFFGVPQTPIPGTNAPLEPVVVSIGLVSHADDPNAKIYALREPFYLDVFVFNQSSRMLRFELSHPDTTRRRHDHTSVRDTNDAKGPAILPLENRIRIGPLRPQASQSVRFPFLALQAGVHSISSLQLTDTETGYSINMRSIIDVVVHEAVDTHT